MGYTDPTGHSLLSRIGGGLKSAVGVITHAGGKLVDIAKKVILPLVPVIVSAKNTIFPSKDAGTNKNKQNQSRFNSKDAKKIYSDFKTYASVATQIIREEVKRELCSDKQVHIQYQGTPKDWFTLGLGAAEIMSGVKGMGLGLGLTAMSGGAASEIAIPVAVTGAAAISLGTATTSAALLNMFEMQVSQSASDTTSSSDENQSNKNPKQGNSGTGNNAGKSSGSTQRGSGKPSGSGSDFKSGHQLDSHYNKHANEFGDISKEEYLKGANDLINSTSDDVLTKTRTNGDTIFYNPNTNEFAVKSADGYIRTYFKPSDGIGYFNRQ